MPKLGETLTSSQFGQFTLPTMEELAQRFGQDTAAGVNQLLSSGTSPINIRELDEWTGNKHYEYEIPGGQQSFQPNLYRYGLNSEWNWQGPGQEPASGPPTGISVPRDPTGGLDLSRMDKETNQWKPPAVKTDNTKSGDGVGLGDTGGLGGGAGLGDTGGFGSGRDTTRSDPSWVPPSVRIRTNPYMPDYNPRRPFNFDPFGSDPFGRKP